MVRPRVLLCLALFGGLVSADIVDRDPLEYVPTPPGTYVPPKNSSISTLLDVIKSRDDLSTLAEVLSECAGMLI
jgi:hypothetical protein